MVRTLPVLCLVLVLSVAPQYAGAAEDVEMRPPELEGRRTTVLPVGRTIDRDYVAAGETVEISGIVNGDVYAAGAQIVVDGTINGDLLAAGGTVTITGVVTQDIRVMGGRVTIAGEIGRNVTVAGGNVELLPSALLRGNLVAAGGSVEMAAVVEQDVKVAAGKSLVSNRVGGDATIAAGSIRLTSKAAVDGNLIYWSEWPASIDDQAFIGGRVVRRPLPAVPSSQDLLLAFAGLKLTLAAAGFLSSLVLGLLLFRFYPHAMERTSDHLLEQPFASLGIGLLVVLLTPLAIAVFAATLIGIPLALVLLCWYAVILYVSRIAVIAFAGRLLFEQAGVGSHPRWGFLLGLVLYYLVTLLPVVGFVMTFLTVLLGTGALVRTKKDVYDTARAQELV